MSFLIFHTSLTGWEQLLCLVDVQVKHTINRQTKITPCLEESPLHIPLIFPTQDTVAWTRICRVCSKWVGSKCEGQSTKTAIVNCFTPKHKGCCSVDITPAGYVTQSAAPCQRHCLFTVQNNLTCPWCPHCTEVDTSREEFSGRWFPKPTAEQTRCAELQWTEALKYQRLSITEESSPVTGLVKAKNLSYAHQLLRSGGRNFGNLKKTI